MLFAQSDELMYKYEIFRKLNYSSVVKLIWISRDLFLRLFKIQFNKFNLETCASESLSEEIYIEIMYKIIRSWKQNCNIKLQNFLLILYIYNILCFLNKLYCFYFWYFFFNPLYYRVSNLHHTEKSIVLIQ